MSNSIVDLAKKNLDWWSSEEAQHLSQVWMDKKATLVEIAKLAEKELLECQDCLPPLAPSNGRTVDEYHAANAAMRAWVMVMKLREKLEVK